MVRPGWAGKVWRNLTWPGMAGAFWLVSSGFWHGGARQAWRGANWVTRGTAGQARSRMAGLGAVRHGRHGLSWCAVAGLGSLGRACLGMAGSGWAWQVGQGLF